MPQPIRRLAPVLAAEFGFAFVLAVFSDALASTVVPNLYLVVSLSIFPFVAGYVVARANASLRLRHCAIAGVSLSAASITAIVLAFAYTAPRDQYLLAIAGYILSTIFALAPQALFGLLGGWVERKRRPRFAP